MFKKLVKRFFMRKVSIPSYEEKRAIILAYRNNYKSSIFVETGTFLGDTIQSLSTEFDQLYSIELSEELAKKAQQKFVHEKHIKIIQGNSDVILKDVLPELRTQSIFWLDGHYSGEFTLNNNFIQTAKGLLNTPVLQEIDLILNCDIKHIILIDDARLFNGKEDYPTIRHLKKILRNHKDDWEFKILKDIIRILPKNK